MPEKTITVLLVEDDAEVRRRFETTINQDPMMKVVGFASTKHEAQQLIETLDFEVMVIDLGLPDGSGIDLIRLANRLHPSSDIMVITVYGDEQHVVSSIEAGATSSRKPIAKISPARFGCCEAADLLSARQSREACSARCRIIRPAMASFLMPNRARFLPAKRKFCIFSRRV